MSFGFLFPWIWVGAAALVAPVWLHMRRDRAGDVVRFSALRFLDDEPQPRRRPFRLRDLLLLLLRTLALVLLVAAFAWPYHRTPPPVLATESRVYVLDNTMSRQAGDGLTRDRDRLLAELGRAGRAVQVAVVELTNQPRVVAGFGDDRATAARQVAALEPSYQRGPYLAAFRMATGLLAHSLGQKRTIVFLGDNQENQWTENASVAPFLRDVAVELPATPAPEAPNLAVANPRAQRIVVGEKSLVDLAFDLSHQGAAESVVVTVRANDQEVLRRELPIGGQPSTITLGAQWETDPAQGVRGEVAISGRPDALAADNRIVFALPPVVEGTVALLADSPYLRAALAPEIMRGRWSTRIIAPSRLGDELTAPTDAEVMCLEAHYLQSAQARALTLRYLNGGRGVFLLIDRDSPLIHGFLRELGFELQGDVAGASGFRYVFGEHPVLHPFRSPDFGDLMEVRVHRHRKVKASRAQPLIFGETGDVLLFQGAATKGRLFVASFGFDRAETDWPVHPTFIPFLDLVLQNARVRDETPTNYEPGEVALFHLPPGSKATEVVLRQGDRERAREPFQNARARVRLPDTPGLYTATGAGGPSDVRTLSVNPAPPESQLNYLAAPPALHAWRLDPAPSPAQVEPAQAEVSQASLLQQRYWWPLLLCGLAALAGESLWLTFRKERA